MYDFILDPLGDVILLLENAHVPPDLMNRDSTSNLMDRDSDIGLQELWKEEDPSAANKERRATDEALAKPHSVVTFLVSSRHLILASPVLKATLTGEWKEANHWKTDHFREIHTDGWDVRALDIVLRIIHHKWSEVPRSLSVELLSKLAIIVDYYQMQEIGQLIDIIWLSHLRREIPTSYKRELILWLCVSTVFRDAEAFRDATEVVIKECPKDLEAQDLPIPTNVIGQFQLG